MKRYGWFALMGVIVLAALVLSCGDKTPVSLGEDWEIYVIADQKDWDAVGPIIEDALEKKLVTPLVEDEYVVKHVLPKEMDKYLMMRNLLIISSMEEGKSMDNLLRKTLSKELYNKIVSGEEYLFVARDQWTRDQFIVFLAAKGVDLLKASVASYPDFIYNLFNRNRNERLRQRLFLRTLGRIELRFKVDYDWTMKIPIDYKLVYENKDEHLVHFQCPEPERNIFVHWIDNAKNIELTENWMVDKLNWIGKVYHQAKIEKGYYFTRKRRFENYEALTIIGLWQSDTKNIGGPVHAVAFRDTDQNRIYIIMGTVFAPDRRKEPYLRELEIITNTFKAFTL